MLSVDECRLLDRASLYNCFIYAPVYASNDNLSRIKDNNTSAFSRPSFNRSLFATICSRHALPVPPSFSAVSSFMTACEDISSVYMKSHSHVPIAFAELNMDKKANPRTASFSNTGYWDAFNIISTNSLTIRSSQRAFTP